MRKAAGLSVVHERVFNRQSKGLLGPHFGLYERLALFPLMSQMDESCVVCSECLGGVRRLAGNVDLVYALLELFELGW